MIRVAQESDMPELLRIAEEFYRLSPHAVCGELSPERMAGTFKIALDSGALVVLDRNGIQGLAVAIIFPSSYVEQLWAQEVGWYVRPEYRSSGFALLAALEAECAMKGVKRIIMGVLNNEHKPRIVGSLEDSGYKELESLLYKEL